MAIKWLHRRVTIQNPRFLQKHVDRFPQVPAQPLCPDSLSILLRPRRTESSLTTRLIPRSSALTVSPRNAVKCAYRPASQNSQHSCTQDIANLCTIRTCVSQRAVGHERVKSSIALQIFDKKCEVPERRDVRIPVPIDLDQAHVGVN